MAGHLTGASQGLADGIQDGWFGGKLDHAIAMYAQASGRIEAIQLILEIISETVRNFTETVSRMAEGLR